MTEHNWGLENAKEQVDSAHFCQNENCGLAMTVNPEGQIWYIRRTKEGQFIWSEIIPDCPAN